MPKPSYSERKPRPVRTVCTSTTVFCIPIDWVDDDADDDEVIYKLG